MVKSVMLSDELGHTVVKMREDRVCELRFVFSIDQMYQVEITEGMTKRDIAGALSRLADEMEQA